MAAKRDDFFVEGGRHQRAPVSLMAAMRVDFSSRGEGFNGPPASSRALWGPDGAVKWHLQWRWSQGRARSYQMLGILKVNRSESFRGLAALFS